MLPIKKAEFQKLFNKIWLTAGVYGMALTKQVEAYNGEMTKGRKCRFVTSLNWNLKIETFLPAAVTDRYHLLP